MVTPPPKNVLGANFNGAEDWSDLGQLRDVSATWLRGFFPVPEADQGVVADQPVVRTVLSAAQHRNTPRLNAFYEAIARRVIAFRDQHGGASNKTKLYMGALNRLNEPAWRTAATDHWMSFTRGTAALDGVDIHPHVAALDAVQPFLDYVLPRLRAGQTFLALEFSLVHHWRAHLSDPVSEAFAARYGIPATTRVWEVIADAIRRPSAQQKWDDFLALSPWFGPNSTPWLLNSMFCPYTVQLGSDGLPGRNTTWITSFRDLQ